MVYKCSVCGYVYDEEKEGKPFYELTGCPVCKQPPERFKVIEMDKTAAVPTKSVPQPAELNSGELDLS